MIDTAIFALNAGTTIYTAAQDNVSQKALRVSVGATAAALWLLSAIYGYSKISECREAVATYAHGYHRLPSAPGARSFPTPAAAERAPARRRDEGPAVGVAGIVGGR